MRRLDTVGLASTAAALQLLPENGNSLWRLEVLASLASEKGIADDPISLTAEIVDHLVNQGQLAVAASQQEDPMDDLLCEELAFHGGSFLVGGGLSEASTFVFRALSRGLLLRGDLPTELTGELSTCAIAALKVSDAVLRGAGLSRNVEPPPQRGSVTIPDAGTLSELQRLTAFDQPRLESLLRRREIEAIEPLIEDAESREFSDEEIFHGSTWKPLLRVGDWLVLHRPFDLLNALRHHFSLRAAEVCGAERVDLAFARAIQREVTTAVGRMNIREKTVSVRDADTPFTEIRCRCDSDKEIVALILTDDFVGIESDDPFTTWDGHERIELAKARVEAIAAARASEEEQILGLLIMQPAGRLAMLLAPATETPGVFFEVLTAADLDTIGVLETGDALGLWKFASASNKLGRVARLNLSSTLDLYGTYRGAERTLAPFMDATAVMIPPGSGGPYRRDARSGRDRHGVPHPNYSIREVERETSNQLDRRIYHETNISESRQSLMVSGAPLALWVAGPERDVLASWDAVDTVAYWLGELAEPLSPTLERASKHHSSLLIEVDFSPWSYWFEEPEIDPGGDDTFTVELVQPEIAAIHFGPAVRRLLLGPDNAGDRLIVAALIESIAAVLAERNEEPPTSAERSEAVEAVAPLGVKKHLISIAIEANPMMDPIEGRPRQRQEADSTDAEVDVGRHLVATFGYRGEPVPKERRNDVLKEAVAFLFDRAQATFHGVNPELLLEELIYANELLIRNSQHSLSILPSKLSTYPAASVTLREEISEANLTGTCCRFLIEYVTARPPSGAARWSLSRYDKALASAADLLRWADLSDAVHGKLTDVDLLIRDDGRLRLLESDRFDAGRGEFFTQHVEQQRQRASDEWDELFTDSDSVESDTTKRLNDLMIDEAGVSLLDLGGILVAANLVARERDEEVVSLPYDEAIAALASQFEDQVDSIASGVDYLSMGPRDSFLDPPTGRSTDTFPWLFARRWSYNRRPFLRRAGASEGGHLLWGRRHVVQSMQILFGQLGAGQYQALAETEPLRKELGRIAKEEGAKFEKEVEEATRAAGWLACRGVRRLDNDRLQRSNGETLGDIDVLAGSDNSPILWAVECKSLNGSLSSAELAREMSDHFRPEGKSSVAKHTERVAWLQERGAAAARLLGLPEADHEVRGLVVTGREAMAPFIDDIPFEIVSIKQLPGFLTAAAKRESSL